MDLSLSYGLNTSPTFSDWILATGFWRDEGVWIDGDVWND